ncbi:MAG: hypothetical protein K2X53_02540, partial [Alphaproteobacteria bacterium]|nr:hypothetical protein [Alphaproteobacteria bacterium]
MKSVLPFFSPTEIVLIDDDQTILETIELNLASLNITLKSFNKPSKGMDYIKQQSIVEASKNLSNPHQQIF